MDVYIDKKEKVWVVNVEAYDDAMNTGLFSKEELDAIMDKEELVYRVVEEEGSTLPSEQLFYQLPLDMQKLSSDKEVAEFISNLKQYCVCSTLPISNSIVFVQHFQPQAVACMFNTSNLKQWRVCSIPPTSNSVVFVPHFQPQTVSRLFNKAFTRINCAESPLCSPPPRSPRGRTPASSSTTPARSPAASC